MWPRTEVSPKRSTSVPAVHLMTGRDPPGPLGRKPLRQDRASQSQVLFKGVTRRRAPSTTPATQTRSLQDRCSSMSNGVNSVSNSIDPAGSRCREAVSSPRVFGMGAGPCQGRGRGFEPRLPLHVHFVWPRARPTCDWRETEYSLEHKCAATEIAKVLSVRIARALAFEVNFTSASTPIQTPVSLPLLRPLELRRAA
jgi:hypothetical protein